MDGERGFAYILVRNLFFALRGIIHLYKPQMIDEMSDEK